MIFFVQYGQSKICRNYTCITYVFTYFQFFSILLCVLYGFQAVAITVSRVIVRNTLFFYVMPTHEFKYWWSVTYSLSHRGMHTSRPEEELLKHISFASVFISLLHTLIREVTEAETQAFITYLQQSSKSYYLIQFCIIFIIYV